MDETAGSIIFEAAIESDQFDAGAAKLENRARKAAQAVDKTTHKIAELRDKLKQLESAKIPTSEFARMTAEAERAEQKLARLRERESELRESGASTHTQSWSRLQLQIEKAEDEVQRYNAALDRMRSDGSAFTTDGAAIEQTHRQLEAAQGTLEQNIARQREANAALQDYNIKAQQTAPSVSQVSEQFAKFNKRIAGLSKRVFIFGMITKALRTMRTALMSTIGADSQMSASLAQIKGNLISAFAPIYNFIIPAIRALLGWLAQLSAIISSVFNTLFGVSAKQAQKNAAALYGQASATKAAGSAAAKAEKQLASFDTINKLSANNDSGGGGGGSGGGGITPDFSGIEDVKLPDQLQKALERIKDSLGRIGGALKRVWENPAVQYIVKSVIYTCIDAICRVVDGVADVLEGVADILGGDGGIWGGLMKVLKGLLKIIDPFGVIESAILNVWALGKKVVAWLKKATSDAAAWAKKKWSDVRSFFKTLGVNIRKTWDDLWSKVKSGAKTSYTNVTNAFKSAPQWFKTNVADKVSSAFSSAFSGATQRAKEAYNGIINTFKSIPEWFRTTFTQAWVNVKNVFSTGGKIYSGIKEGIERTFRSVVNALISGINKIIKYPFEKINSMLNAIRNVKVLGKTPFSGLWKQNPITVPQIPALARGAVIPGGKSFLAMLGDQPRGQTNIETPLSTMIDAFRRAGAGRQTIILKIGEKEVRRFVYDAYNDESARRGPKLGGSTA